MRRQPCARQPPRGELQAGSSPQRRRSVGRTVGGIFLMAVGTPILLYSLGRDESWGEAYALGGALVVSGGVARQCVG